MRAGVCAAETVSTLKFAHRAKSVRNSAHVNEDADQRTLLRKYEQELRKLRAELQLRQREVVDKRHLLAVSARSRLPALKTPEHALVSWDLGVRLRMHCLCTSRRPWLKGRSCQILN